MTTDKNPVNAYKTITSNDYKVTKYPVYAPHSYTYTSGSTNSVDVQVLPAVKYNQSSRIRVADTTYDLYDSVVQSFYSSVPYTSYGLTPQAFIPEQEVYVVSITQDIFGEEVRPDTLSIRVGTSHSYDDGKGNLIISSSGTGSIIGTVFYDKGVAVVKSAGYTNLNPDPLWEDEEGGNLSPDGWQHLEERKLTSQLGVDDGVFHPFPKQETYAAKIATRTSLYVSSYSFYNISVTAGNTYRISGWVYGGGTTWRGIQNGKVVGSDYPLGYYLDFLDGGSTIIDSQTVKTDVGPIGWQYLSKEFIAPATAVSLRVAAFIDGPYPAGYGYGDPVCSDSEAASGCPGYAWFAGLKIEEVNPPQFKLSSGGLTNDGMYVVNGTAVNVSFTSSVKLYEHLINIKVDPAEFKLSPYTPHVYSASLQGSTAPIIDLMVSESVKPYVTSIGLYNSNNDLLAVAKLSNPIKRSFDSTQTFVVKFDT
jgi:hypothetical protein